VLSFVEIIKFNNAYLEQLQSHGQKEKELIILCWKVKELTEDKYIETPHLYHPISSQVS